MLAAVTKEIGRGKLCNCVRSLYGGEGGEGARLNALLLLQPLITRYSVDYLVRTTGLLRTHNSTLQVDNYLTMITRRVSDTSYEYLYDLL